MPKMVIIADDLSGAADCGIVCTQAGLDTLVILGDRADAPESEVLSIDADTRGRSQAAAVAEMVTLTRRYGGPVRLLFKKLDSTLRGHVGAELAAMLRTRHETGPAFIVMAPAFPATGRSTIDGMQWDRRKIGGHNIDGLDPIGSEAGAGRCPTRNSPRLRHAPRRPAPDNVTTPNLAAVPPRRQAQRAGGVARRAHASAPPSWMTVAWFCASTDSRIGVPGALMSGTCPAPHAGARTGPG